MTPLASLSLDLDNQWSYMKTRGDERWRDYPSYLDVVVPRALDFLAGQGLTITVFVVGRDAAFERNHELLASIPGAGHEVGNHSFRHEPWLHRYPAREVEEELTRAEDAIHAATGIRTDGFRGPGYSLSEAALRVLVGRGYRFDASTFPTFVGPLARAFYFRSARLTEEERRQRSELFGTFRDGTRPLRPYRWRVDGSALVELPVTTFPVVRLPFHFSYLLWLAGFSPAVARAYFAFALASCRAARVEPSLLLHPLDFLSAEDVPELAFFPAMAMPWSEKRRHLDEFIHLLRRRFDVRTVGEHSDSAARNVLPSVDAGSNRRSFD